jgi:hypothetical protein
MFPEFGGFPNTLNAAHFARRVDVESDDRSYNPTFYIHRNTLFILVSVVTARIRLGIA